MFFAKEDKLFLLDQLRPIKGSVSSTIAAMFFSIHIQYKTERNADTDVDKHKCNETNIKINFTLLQKSDGWCHLDDLPLMGLIFHLQIPPLTLDITNLVSTGSRYYNGRLLSHSNPKQF